MVVIIVVIDAASHAIAAQRSQRAVVIVVVDAIPLFLVQRRLVEPAVESHTARARVPGTMSARQCGAGSS